MNEQKKEFGIKLVSIRDFKNIFKRAKYSRTFWT